MRELQDKDGVDVYRDTGEPVPSDHPIFRVGELVQIYGGWFRIHAVRHRKLILKCVPQAKALAEIARKDNPLPAGQ